MYILELFLNTMHYDISEHLSLLLQNMMNFVQIQLLFKGKISGRGSSLQNFFEICNLKYIPIPKALLPHLAAENVVFYFNLYLHTMNHRKRYCFDPKSYKYFTARNLLCNSSSYNQDLLFSLYLLGLT